MLCCSIALDKRGLNYKRPARKGEVLHWASLLVRQVFDPEGLRPEGSKETIRASLGRQNSISVVQLTITSKSAILPADPRER